MEQNAKELLRNSDHCIQTCMYTIVYGNVLNSQDWQDDNVNKLLKKGAVI